MSMLSKFINNITGNTAEKAASQAHDDANAATANANAAVQPFSIFGQKYGLEGLASLQNDPSSLANSPQYQFTRDQGLEALNRTAAASGYRGSGNILQELTKYASGLASQTYSDEFNRRYNLATLGANAASRVSTNTLQGGEDASSLMFQGGRDQGMFSQNLLNSGINLFGKMNPLGK
jgi:hypothetical protein